jgi:hypothetical protein
MSELTSTGWAEGSTGLKVGDIVSFDCVFPKVPWWRLISRYREWLAGRYAKTFIVSYEEGAEDLTDWGDEDE